MKYQPKSAAHEDQKADFFAMGTAIIVDEGRNSASGNYTCDGTVVMKVYSIAGQAKNISSGTVRWADRLICVKKI